MAAKAKARKTAIAWPFASKAIDTNPDTGLLKFIALLAMACDHAGKMLFPQYPIMRIIGRLAFPLYAYCLAVGCVYTKNPLKYLERILLLALISQPIYAVAMGHTTKLMYAVPFAENPLKACVNFYVQSYFHPSIFCTLAVGLIACWAVRKRRFVFMLATAVFVFKVQGSLDYGWKGVVLIVLFFLTIRNRWISIPAMAVYMFWWGMQGSGYMLFGYRFGIQMFALAALPLVYLPLKGNLKVNKWIYYWFYPAHLIVIYVLDHYVLI